MACPLCKGPGLRLGALGLLIWYRCRDCGMQWSRRAPKKVREAQGVND